MYRVIHTAGAAALLAATGAVAQPAYPSIFGVQMMSRISVPECPFSAIALKHPESFRGSLITDPYDYRVREICYKRTGTRAMSGQPLGDEFVNIEYPFQQQPKLASTVSAKIIGGVVQEIIFGTGGVASQELVLAALEQKFGKAAQQATTSEQNGFGAKFEVIRASWLVAGDISVTFDGANTRFDHGMVMVQSPAARAQRAEEARRTLGTPL